MHSSSGADGAYVHNGATVRASHVFTNAASMKTTAQHANRSDNERVPPHYDLPLGSDEDDYDQTAPPRPPRAITGGSVDCTRCGNSFWNEESFRVHACNYHQDRVDSKPVMCRICQRTYHEDHERQVLNQQIFYCRQCPSICRGKASLQAHYRQEHDSTASFSCCDSCLHHFTQATSPLGMRPNHTGGMPRQPQTASIMCVLCGATFENTAKHEAHLQIHHPGSSTLPSYHAQPHLPINTFVGGAMPDKHEALGGGGQQFFFPGTGSQERHPGEMFERNESMRPRHYVGSHGQIGAADGTGVFPNNLQGHGPPPGAGIFGSLSKADGMAPMSRTHHPLGAPRPPYTNGSTKVDHSDGGGRTFMDNHMASVPHPVPQGRPYQVFDDGPSPHGHRNSGVMTPATYGGSGPMKENGMLGSRYPPGMGISSASDTLITCRTCGLRFQSPTTFEQHECRGCLIRKEPKRTISCDHCQAELKNEQNLKRHVSVVHGVRQPFGCPQCSASFSSRGSLKIHQQSVHGMQDTTSYLAGDTSNRRIRNGPTKKIEKTYSCPLCPDTFKWKGNLKRHRQLVHEKIKPFTCNICKAKFGTKSNMRVHLITHEKIR